MYSRTLRNSTLLFTVVTLPFVLFSCHPSPSYTERLARANALLTEWQLREAEQSLEPLAADFPDSLEVRRSYAECLLKRGELARACDEYAFLIRTDPASHREYELSLATALFFLGHLDSSASLAESVLREFPGGENPGLSSGAFHLLGRIAFNRASYGEAMTLQRKSLAFARAAASLQAEADAMRQIGVLYWYAGKTDSACGSFYERALELYRRTGDKIGEATTLNNIGVATGAPPYLLGAFAIRKQIGDQIGLADSYYFVTGPVAGGHWNDLAYSLRLKSLSLSTAIGYAWGKEVAARGVDQMAFGLHDSLSFTRALVESTRTSGEGMILRLQIQSSELMRDRNWTAAAALRERIVFLCDSLQYLQGLGMALAQYAVVLTRKGDYGKAGAVVSRLRDVWYDRPNHVDTFLAEIYQARGMHREAADLLWKVVRRHESRYKDNLEQEKIEFSMETGRYFHFRYRVFEMLINSLTHVQDTGQAFEALELFRALSLLSPGSPGGDMALWARYLRAIEAVETESTVADSLVEEFDESYNRAASEHSALVRTAQGLPSRKVPPLRELRRAMDPNEVLADYFLGTEGAYLVAVRRTGSRLIRLPTAVDDINSSAKTFVELILRGKQNPGDSLWAKPARFLFHALLTPLLLEGLLSDGERLIISPHGNLKHIPWSAFIDQQGRFAKSRFTVSYLGAGSSLDPGRNNVTTSGAIAFVPESTTLRFAMEEADAVPDGFFGPRVILTGSDARVAEFLQRAPSASLIHVVAHGTLERWQPLASSFRLSDGPLTLQSILSTHLTASLVVLSACETGSSLGIAGDVSMGHTQISFPDAFLRSGAGTVISPLWVVEDQSTAQLIRRFYFHLQRLSQAQRPVGGDLYPVALSLAQQDFAQNTVVPGRFHPFFWAGFTAAGHL